MRTAPPLSIVLVPVRQSANQLQGDVTAANRDLYRDQLELCFRQRHRLLGVVRPLVAARAQQHAVPAVRLDQLGGGIDARITPVSPSTATVSQLNSVSPGSSLASSHWATMSSWPRHGSAHGSVKYSASSVNKARMSSGSFDSHARRYASTQRARVSRFVVSVMRTVYTRVL